MRPESGRISSGTVVTFLLLAGGGWIAWTSFIESRVQEGNFDNALEEMGSLELVEKGSQVLSKAPHRRGRVLVITPRRYVSAAGKLMPAHVHPAWHELDRSIRASSPEQVETLIHITLHGGEARLYSRGDRLHSKVANSNDVRITAFAWPEQTVLGSLTLEAGQFADEMTEEQIDALIEAVSPEAIAAAIEAMPEG